MTPQQQSFTHMPSSLLPLKRLTAAAALLVLSLHTTAVVVLAKPIRFASPLHSLTIPDRPKLSSPRAKFFGRFKAGVEAESKVRRDIAAEERRQRQEEIAIGGTIKDDDDDDENEDFFQSTKWAELSTEKQDNYKAEKKRRISDAFDEGFQSVKEEEEKVEEVPSAKAGNEYQFVGVVNPPSSSSSNGVKWYARKKPKDATWSVRVLHVDKAAVMRDLFVKGKIDLYGKYTNKGFPTPTEKDEQESDAPLPTKPIVEVEYSIKERSWRNVWNFSPKALFTDRSGMYWRQRRLSPGIYTDGEKVYESTYHYAEGRNGMKVVGNNLKEYLDKHDIAKDKIMERLNGGSSPDLVLEY